jgi:hypothetical protein
MMSLLNQTGVFGEEGEDSEEDFNDYFEAVYQTYFAPLVTTLSVSSALFVSGSTVACRGHS